MIRNKTSYFIAFKRSRRGPISQAPLDAFSQQPCWFEDYHRNREILQQIHADNESIEVLVNQYQSNPTIYALKQMERLIARNCRHIDEVDRWIELFQCSRSSQPGLRANEEAIAKHFQVQLAKEIMIVFNCKQVITDMNNRIGSQPGNSFARPPASHTSSFIEGELGDRNRLFEEVNYKIENLNIVLRRMNAMVATQGDLINRIDENLASGKQHIQEAQGQLRKRVEREQGGGQFSLEGKVNQAITGLYFVNLVLIVVFFLKNVLL